MNEAPPEKPLSAAAPVRRKVGLQLGVGLATVLGMLLLFYLLLHNGVRQVAQVLQVAGWGLLWLIPFHIFPLTVDATAWRVILHEHRRATLPFLFWNGAVRDAINSLLPVARVGGEVASIRLLMARGIPGSVAAASMIVEITLALAMQLLFTLLGLIILLYYLRDSAASRVVLVGLLIGVPLLVVFFFMQQRVGMFQLLERGLTALTGRKVLSLAGEPARLDEAVRHLYGQRRALILSSAWQFATMIASAAEVWFALWLLGHPVGPAGAILLESLAQAIQSASFLIPASLGVQEGGFILFGAALGLSPSVALALSLARRVRQVGFGLPALLSWQWVEGRKLHRYVKGRLKD